MAATLAEKAERAESVFLEDYAKYSKDALSTELKEANEASIQRFREIGLYHRSDELFTYVSLSRIIGSGLRAVGVATEQPTAAEIASHIYAECAESVAVFVNGEFRREFSNFSALSGMLISDLEEALSESAEIPADSCLKESDQFALLNGAFVSSGIYIEVPAGFSPEKTVQILHISTSAENRLMVTPRVVLKLGAGAELKIVQKFAGAGRNIFVNFVANAAMGSGSSLAWYGLKNEGADCFNFSKYRFDMAGQSSFEGLFAQTGSALARNHFEADLMGENIEFALNGISVVDNEEEAHNFIRVNHGAPECRSSQIFKNILKGKGRTSIDTTVNVLTGARQTVSDQLVNNLILSPQAKAGVKPNLMIHADDVKCTHGATVGQISDEQIFYLKTRGLPEEKARKLLMFGFADEMLQKIAFQPLRDDASRALISRLER